MLGPNLGITEFDEMMYLIEYCDAMGLDNIGGPNVVAFAVELLEVGILKPADLDGIDAKWGDVESIYKLFEALVYRKGKAGELLGMGVYDMAHKVGKGAEKYAVYAKKQGLAAHDPRGDRSRIWTYALGPRGGVHTDGTSAQAILNTILHSSMCMCLFVNACFRERHTSILVDALNPLCGWNLTMDEFMTAGKRILTLQRAYSHREGGVSRKDDTMSDRMFDVPLPKEGPRGGAVITREEMKKAQDEYYAMLEWDDNGLPSDATLKKYGLDFAIPDMRAKK
jgi:aldehyde:ferredoxin oxidoreductase